MKVNDIRRWQKRIYQENEINNEIRLDKQKDRKRKWQEKQNIQ